MGKRKPDQRQPRVTIEGEVLRQIRQHARSNSKTEVCGVLIGEEIGNGLSITARIPGLNAAQAGTYVTFTQDTWEHIYKIKDKDFPDERIVLSEIHVKDDKGGEEAGETGKPEPVGGIEEDEEAGESDEGVESGPPVWLKWVLMAASHLLLATIAFFVALLLFQRPVFFLFDPTRGLIQAPPGTHITSDGTSLNIPGIGDLPVIRPGFRELPPAPEKNSKPQGTEPAAPSRSSGGSSAGSSQAPPQGAAKSENGKDSNVPRK